MSHQHHTWTFPSKGLKAIYDHEICGQLSDGAWENSTPFNHWEFWSNLETVAGDVWRFEFNSSADYSYRYPKKRTAYNLTTLIDPEIVDLSGRMRAYYLNAELELGLASNDVDSLLNSDYLPNTADNVRNSLKNFATTSNYWSERLERLEKAGLEQLCSKMAMGFIKYSRANLIQDLRLIKKQMKDVIEHCY